MTTPTPLAVLDDVTAQLHKVKTDDFSALQDHLNSAIEIVTGMCVPLQPATITDLLDGGQPSVILTKHPVNAVVSVTTYTTSGVPTVLVAAGGTTGVMDGWRIDLSAGVLHRVGYSVWPMGWGNVQVTYTVGPPTVPAVATRAVVALVEHFWQFRKVGGGPNQPGVPTSDTMGYSPSYGVPDQVTEMLRDWLKPARIA